VYDEIGGGIVGAKRLPSLRSCKARYVSEPVSGSGSPIAEIRLPDGTRVLTDAADAPARLSEVLGRPVTLRALGPAGSETAPRATSAGETQDFVRGMMGLLPGEPEPDFSAFPPERLSLLRQGNFFDALPIHLLTRTTLDTLARLAPESMWDPRRFRPNVFVHSDVAEGYPELGWLGRRLRVGRAVFDVVTGCPRCVMVTQPVEDVPQDHRVMRTLVLETKHTAGIYAGVAEEGEMRVGDPVELV
jgi:uncharacterized protein YcbX